MRGRKPKPTALKVLEGNPGKRPLNRREPKHTPTAPTCPAWLPAEGKAEWRRVVPALDKIGMLARVDRAALATYCSAWARLVQAEKLVAQHGQVIFDDHGRPHRNPALLTAKDASQIVRQFCAEFGLTPSSRGRIEMPTPDEADFDELLG